MKEIVIATKNLDKKRELKQLLKDSGTKVISLDKFPDCPKVRETGSSFRENAIRKAMVVSKFTKKTALADDSGLETVALNGRPGVHSSRFSGMHASYAQNNHKLLKVLKGKKDKERGARFKCVIAICNYPRLIGVVEGEIQGRIAQAPKGKHGFGYDPIFVVPKYKKTFAQLTPRIKNKISHRGQALKKAKRLLSIYLSAEKSQ